MTLINENEKILSICIVLYQKDHTCRILHYTLGCVPSGSGSVIQDLSGSWCIKGTDGSTLATDSPVPLMHHDPDKSWITDPDLDHPKGTHP